MEFDLLSYTVFFVAAFLGGFIDAIAGGGGLITLPAIMAMGVPTSSSPWHKQASRRLWQLHGNAKFHQKRTD